MLVCVEEMLHEVQMYTQITPMEIDILFQLADCRHPDGYGHHCRPKLSLLIAFVCTVHYYF